MKPWLSTLMVSALWSSCAGVEPDSQESTWRVEGLEREIDRLRARIDELEQQEEFLRQAASAHINACQIAIPPRIDARVIELVPGQPFVYLDVGHADGVLDGYTFSVFSGSTFKGQVKVVKVEEHRSLAVVTGGKQPIAAGDSASTGL